MLKEELLKTFKSKKSLLLFIYLMLLAFADNVMGILQRTGYGKFGGFAGVHPLLMTLLTGQAYFGFYALFFWIAPVTITLLYCWRHIQENKNRMNYIYVSKSGRKKHFLSKLSCSFVVSVIYFGIPLIVNMIVATICPIEGTSFCGLEDFGIDDFSTFSRIDTMSRQFFVSHPYLGWFVYFAVAMVVLGLMGVMAQSITMIFKDIKVTLCLSFAIWISMYSIEYDMSMAVQPFTEFGLACMGMALLCYIPFVIVSVILAYIFTVVKKDEL